MEETWKPSYVAFCHSGGNLSLLLEVMRKLEESNTFALVKSYSACGNGSLIALLKYVGYSSDEIEKYISPHYNDLACDSLSVDDHAIDRYSLISDVIRNAFEPITVGVPTMKQLYLLTGKRLYLMAYNLTLNKIVYISGDSHPEMNVICAVAICMSPNFSLFYQGHSYIDAVSVEPVPVSCFEFKKKILVLQTSVLPSSLLSQRKMLHQIALINLSHTLFRLYVSGGLYISLRSSPSWSIKRTDRVEEIVEKALQKITKSNKKIIYSKEVFE